MWTGEGRDGFASLKVGVTAPVAAEASTSEARANDESIPRLVNLRGGVFPLDRAMLIEKSVSNKGESATVPK